MNRQEIDRTLVSLGLVYEIETNPKIKAQIKKSYYDMLAMEAELK